MHLQKTNQASKLQAWLQASAWHVTWTDRLKELLKKKLKKQIVCHWFCKKKCYVYQCLVDKLLFKLQVVLHKDGTEKGASCLGIISQLVSRVKGKWVPDISRLATRDDSLTPVETEWNSKKSESKKRCKFHNFPLTFHLSSL